MSSFQKNNLIVHHILKNLLTHNESKPVHSEVNKNLDSFSKHLYNFGDNL